VHSPVLYLDGHDLQAELLGFALQVLDGVLAGLLFIVPFARVTILGLVLEHSVDDAGQLVRRGGCGARRTAA